MVELSFTAIKGHQYRNNKNDLLKGKSKRNFTYQYYRMKNYMMQLYNIRALYLIFILISRNKVFLMSIFFLLKTNVIYYNLNVMHIKKNMFDNIFNMIMNMKEKTKII